MRTSSSWTPHLIEVWVRQPGTDSLVLGWYREGVQPFPNALFLSNGDVQVMTFEELSMILVTPDNPDQLMRDPHVIALHPLLRPSARDALTNREYMTMNGQDPD